MGCRGATHLQQIRLLVEFVPDDALQAADVLEQAVVLGQVVDSDQSAGERRFRLDPAIGGFAEITQGDALVDGDTVDVEPLQQTERGDLSTGRQVTTDEGFDDIRQVLVGEEVLDSRTEVRVVFTAPFNDWR